MEEAITAIYVGTGFSITLILTTLVIVLQAQRKRSKLQLQLSEQQITQQKELTHNTINSHEEERQRLGRELHDDLGQNLTFVKMNLQRFKEKQNPESLDHSIEVLERSIEKCSHLSKILYPVVLKKFGLKNGLLQLIHDLTEDQIDIVFEADDIDLGEEMNLNVYRVFQELLNNTLKYAKATQVKMLLHEKSDAIHLEYSDDGIGFEVDERHSGLGMQNIATRAHGLQADLTINSSAGQGVKAHLSIPLNLKV